MSKVSCKPRKSWGPWLGLGIGLLIFSFIIWGIDYSLGNDDKTLKILLYIPTYFFGVIYVYLILGAFSLAYQVTDTALILKWGIQRKNIPWNEFEEISQIKGSYKLLPFLSASWPGYSVGLYNVPGLGSVRMYATRLEDGFLYLKTKKGFFGITPQDPNLGRYIANKTGKDLQTLKFEEKEDGLTKGKGLFSSLYILNIVLLIFFAAYLAIFYPSSGAPSFIVLLLVIAIPLLFFNLANAKRLFFFSPAGGYIILSIAMVVNLILFSLAIYKVGF